MRYLTLPAAICFALLGPFAQAATFNENDIAGGFSSDFTAPTQISAGFEDVVGTLGVGEYDIFSFTDLAPGAQTISLTFDLQTPPAVSGFQNAGGYVRFQETPFLNSPEEGSRTDFSLVFDPFNPAGAITSQTLTFDLDSSFTGSPLFFATRLTFSSQGPLSFGTIAPGNAVAPIPAPATGLLLITALAGAAALRRRKPQPQLA